MAEEIIHKMIVEEMSQLAFNTLFGSRGDPSEGSEDLSHIALLQMNQQRKKDKRTES